MQILQLDVNWSLKWSNNLPTLIFIKSQKYT